MPTEPIRDYQHFITIQGENFKKNTINFNEAIPLIQDLDNLFRACLELKPIDKPELKIPDQNLCPLT